MERLSEVLGSGALAWALPIALLGGLISFFSPCIIPLLPVYFSYISGVSVETVVNDEAPRGRMLTSALLFVLGFGVTFTVIGAAFSSVSRYVIGYGTAVSVALGSFLILLGLLTIANVQIPALQRTFRVSLPRGGLIMTPLIGAALAITWTPCVGPVLGAIYTLGYGDDSAWRVAALLAAYSVGLGVPFIAAALAWRRTTSAVSWMKRHQRLVSSLSGGFMVLIGLVVVLGFWTVISQDLQRLALDWGFGGF